MAHQQRIHIVGGSGSGKTTLARQLATRADAPTYDLDVVAYEGGAGRKRSLPERLADVHQNTFEPAWITEGIYLWWTDELLTKADVIVWLDLPWRIAAWQIVARHVRTSLAGTNRHRGLRNLLMFLSSTRRYYGEPASTPTALDDDGATTRDATHQSLIPYTAKLIHCRRAAEVRALLDCRLLDENTQGSDSCDRSR